MLNLDDVAIFVAVAHARSLSSVARTRGVAQTTLGRSIRRLEEGLGVALLQRQPRSSKLTAAGELFLAHAERLLDSSLKIEREMMDWSRTPRGTVRVSLCRALARTRLAPPLARWATAHPTIRLEIILEERWIDPATEGVDLAVRSGVPRDVTSVATPIGRYGHTLCAAPSYLRGKSLPKHPRELPQYTLLSMHTDRPWTRWPFRRSSESWELEVRASIDVDDAGMLYALTIAGAGLTVLPTYLIQHEIEENKLQTVLPEWVLPEAPIFALHAPRRSMTAAARDLLATLVGDSAR